MNADEDTTETSTEPPATSTSDVAGAPDEQAPIVEETAPETPAPPAASASKAAWVEWVSTHAPEDQRLSAEEAGKHTRNQLAEMFTPADPGTAEKPFGWFVTEGGSTIKMDFPLDKAIAERVVKGAIVQVADEAGTPLAEPRPLDLNSVDYVAAFAPPPKTASRAVWIGHAVRHGRFTVEAAEQMTTQDLIDYFTK